VPPTAKRTGMASRLAVAGTATGMVADVPTATTVVVIV